jgi:hypothetical protein
MAEGNVPPSGLFSSWIIVRLQQGQPTQGVIEAKYQQRGYYYTRDLKLEWGSWPQGSKQAGRRGCSLRPGPGRQPLPRQWTLQ